MSIWTLISKFRGMALTLAAAGVFFAISAGASGSANAALTSTVEFDDGTMFSCVDNDPCDSNSTVGVINWTTSYENWVLDINIGISKPIIGDAETAALNLSVIAVSNGSNTTDSTMTVSLTDDGYTSPTGDVTALSTVGGSWADAVDFQTSLTDGNGTQALTSASFTQLPPGSIQDGSATGVTSPYALSMSIVMTASAGTSLSGSVDTTLKVPEPMSLALFGTGLLMLGFLAYGRARKSGAHATHRA